MTHSLPSWYIETARRFGRRVLSDHKTCCKAKVVVVVMRREEDCYSSSPLVGTRLSTLRKAKSSCYGSNASEER